MSRNERRYRPINYAAYVQPSDSTTDSENRQLRYFPPPPDGYNPYCRRRTADNFPVPEPVHTAPTVARSGLIVSASTNGLSKQASQPSRPRFPLMKFTPTRIPSPIWNVTTKDRHVSTSALPSQKIHKDNVQEKAQRLQGAMLASNRPPPLLPKSRTIGILSNLTTSFSRTNLNVNDCRQASSSATHPADVTTCDSDNIPPPVSTSIIHQIHVSKMNSYWCGRFQSLCDRFHDEQFLVNSEATQQYVTDDSESPSPSSTPILRSKETRGFKMKASKVGDGNTCPPGRVSHNKDEEKDKRSSRAFLHLKSVCTTSEARRSLWEFQLYFARIECKPHLLPKGGQMEDSRGGWFGRVGKAMVWGNNAGFGPRTSIGIGKRKDSMMEFLNP